MKTEEASQLQKGDLIYIKPPLFEIISNDGELITFKTFGADPITMTRPINHFKDYLKK